MNSTDGLCHLVSRERKGLKEKEQGEEERREEGKGEERGKGEAGGEGGGEGGEGGGGGGGESFSHCLARNRENR
jgi:hypothetical protein